MADVPYPTFSEVPYANMQMGAIALRQRGIESLMSAGRGAAMLGADIAQQSIRYHQAKEARRVLVDVLNRMKQKDPAKFYKTGMRDPERDIPPVPRNVNLKEYLNKLNTSISALADSALRQGIMEPGELYSLLKMSPDSSEVMKTLGPTIAKTEQLERTRQVERIAEQAARPTTVELEGPVRPGESPLTGKMPGVQTTSEMLGSPAWSGTDIGAEEVKGTRAYQALLAREAEQKEKKQQEWAEQKEKTQQEQKNREYALAWARLNKGTASDDDAALVYDRQDDNFRQHRADFQRLQVKYNEMVAAKKKAEESGKPANIYRINKEIERLEDEQSAGINRSKEIAALKEELNHIRDLVRTMPTERDITEAKQDMDNAKEEMERARSIRDATAKKHPGAIPAPYRPVRSSSNNSDLDLIFGEQ